MTDKILKYGAKWPAGKGPAWELKIQMACIKKGGEWQNKEGEKCGRGLFYHYKRFQELCWPDDYHHRWSDLQLKTILDSDITVVTGPKDSGKTRCCLTRFGLTDYFCFPDDTLIIVSSTTLAALEGRVWGDMKGMFQRAKDRFDFLPGHVLESKHAIVTDDLDDDAVIARDMRKGILCFIKGSMVDTPTGPKPIESIKVGDEVMNAVGTGKVLETFNRTADKLVRVTVSDGRTLDCTPEHPFFTSRGWINAIDLQIYDVVFSAHETMQIMWGSIGSGLSEQKTLLCPVQAKAASQALRGMRGNVQTVEQEAGWKSLREVLYHSLCREMGSSQTGIATQEDRSLPALQEDIQKCSPQQEVVFSILPTKDYPEKVQAMRESVSIAPTIIDPNIHQFLRQELLKEMERFKDVEVESVTNHAGADSGQNVSEPSGSIQSDDRSEDIAWSGPLVRVGSGPARTEAGHRDRRWDSQYKVQKDSRSETNLDPKRAWVVGVEILEQGSDDRSSESESGYKVHNLHIAGHPSYSVNGVVVHNCVPCKNSSGQFTGISSYVGMKQKRRRHLGDEFQFMSPSMMDSIANMNSGDYKGVFTGNPIGQDDPLDRMSEPECGWEAQPEPTTTTVWKNKRFKNSYTITLFGTDSPTYDTPDGAEKYKGLLNDDSIQRVVAGYGKDSHQYYSQCLGIRKSGLNARRVLTKDLCRTFNAFDQMVWDGSKPTVKICAVDAAYGGAGGDRCVGGHIEFGLTVGNKIGIKVHPAQVIPISIRNDSSPEDKISMWVRTYCESHGIPPENFFYDSTGRGSLGPSLARIWSVQINPVEFGGAATDRPVSLDIFTLDQKTGRKRLKTCKEHYSKFVTELWWTVRYAIESGQIREFPQDVCDEFCGREWKEVAGGRIEIETKKEMKSRTGQSPDLADWFVTALEGARRRGFQITKLANQESASANLDWLVKLREDAAKIRKSRELVY